MPNIEMYVTEKEQQIMDVPFIPKRVRASASTVTQINVGDTETRKSTRGCAMKIGKTPISWSSIKQKIVALCCKWMAMYSSKFPHGACSLGHVRKKIDTGSKQSVFM